ncbi:hypothetical protein ACHAWT_008147 [Skeletonema menzelii]
MGKLNAVKDSAFAGKVSSAVASSALAGKISSICQVFVLSQDDIHQILSNVYEVIHRSTFDLVVLFALGWLFVPAMGVVYDVLDDGKDKIKRVASRAELRKNASSVEIDDKNDGSYENSYIYQFAVHISQAAKLALLVYLCDIVVVALHTVGYNAEGWGNVSTLFAKVLYTSWIANRMQRFKTYFLTKFLHNCPEECDKVQLVNRVLDLTVLALLVVKIMGYFAMETGVALGSIAAFGTTSTLMISFASQELAKGVANGIEMAASDRFFEGDNVHFGDGTQGYIVKLGFLRTKIRKYDGAVLDVPNSQLGGQRLINVSKTKTCQVLTKLRFSYDDIQSIPGALEICKEEIKKSCPALTVEGKPFRAMISSFETNFVEVTFNTNFTLPPTGEKFWANRQALFLAIDRGVKKAGLSYYKPFCEKCVTNQ